MALILSTLFILVVYSWPIKKDGVIIPTFMLIFLSPVARSLLFMQAIVWMINIFFLFITVYLVFSLLKYQPSCIRDLFSDSSEKNKIVLLTKL
jgi:hypothetical protein